MPPWHYHNSTKQFAFLSLPYYLPRPMALESRNSLPAPDHENELAPTLGKLLHILPLIHKENSLETLETHMFHKLKKQPGMACLLFRNNYSAHMLFMMFSFIQFFNVSVSYV